MLPGALARTRGARLALLLALALGAASALGAALSREADQKLAALEHARCAPLRVLDRAGQLLRELPGPCAPYGRAAWTPLSEVPPVVLRMLIASEDRRFEAHAGIDFIGVARAAWGNLRARRIVSGASSLTMQLARMLEPAAPRHAWQAKLAQAWGAIALERRLSKPTILEAYVNLAYYGAGAHGIAAASQAYFGRPLASLGSAEASLLAVLPRAPSAYDPRRHLSRALARRAHVLSLLRASQQLTAAEHTAIVSGPLALAAPREEPAPRAGHFVDHVLRGLSPELRQSGGALHTTLDLRLQQAVERAAAEHVAGLAAQGIDQAGVVVLDTESGAILALSGSRDYRSSQLDIVTRRRQLGSLLKPFVYALAIEAGEAPASLALDVGDASSEYRARDWVGREAGPLSYREALAGSYNLAAINVLERVGVAALHARLRQAGVADLPSPPAHYGLPLALGSARVRLLDVASGYGFLVRGGRVLGPRAITRLEPPAGNVFRPAPAREQQLFSAAASWQVMDMLSDPAARHRRFGRGLPLEAADAARVVAKTGTASGLSDLSAIVATREYIVAAWVGRFDGLPSHGASGMWSAAPLARRVLEIALDGRAPSLPPKPAGVALARSAEPARTPAAAHALEAWAGRARALDAWAERARALGGSSSRSSR